MDIIFTDSDIIEANEDLLIHLFFNVLDYDFRHGCFGADSSIHDMSGCGFTDQDYIQLAQDYHEKCPADYTYTQGQKLYQMLTNERFDNMVIEKFEQIYGFSIDETIHLLTDFVLLLRDKFPNRDWTTDNIFIIKTLNNRCEKEEQKIQEEEKIDTKVVKLPIRKKPTPDEIRAGFNYYLMVKELGMTWNEARELSTANFEKKVAGKKFEPYIPDKKNRKNKI